MNTVEFLKSLKKQYTFVKLRDDLEMFLTNFTPKMFEYNYSKLYPNGASEFLKQLHQDIVSCTTKQFDSFYECLIPNLWISSELTNIIFSACKDYIFKHYKTLEIPKYKEVIFKGIALDFQKELHYPTQVVLKEEKGTAEAAASSLIIDQEQFSKHTLYYYINRKLPKSSKEEQLFRLAYEAFHEEYHCLVSELIENPTCFKEEIYDFAITRFYIQELDLSKFYYDYHYLTNKEEAGADLYAISRAVSYLEEQMPDFSARRPNAFINDITKSAYDNQVTIKKWTKALTEQEWLEEKVEDGIKKYPFLLSGILSRAFNQDGSKKDFITLVKDKKELQKEHENPLLQKDIERFYSILQYKALNKLSEEERLSLFQNEDYQNEALETIVNYINYVKEKTEELKRKKVTILAILNKPQAILVYKKQLRELQNWYHTINQLKKEGLTHGL